MRRTAYLIAALTLVISILPHLASGQKFPAERARLLPEFTSTNPSAWLESEPLSIEDLRGNVALVHIWAFECWNCYRSFPWLNELERSYADRDLRLVGIHTPEFERERERAGVAAAMRKYALKHPVMMDNDWRYWRALDNRYWPAWYLVDRVGRIRAVHIGEVHAGTAAARRIERDLDRLLSEQ